MKKINNYILNRIFTRNTINNMLKEKKSEILERSIEYHFDLSKEISNKNAISKIYDFMLKYYRNEYIYKNLLFNKLLLGRHSLNTTVALTEIPIEKSKVDFVLINGKATAYEIKTELDSFYRLEGQLKDYYKVFKNVYVVTCESNFIKLNEILKATNTGIAILTKRNTISIKKESVEDNSNLNLESMFKVLRKPEYEQILFEHYGELPTVQPVYYYKKCLSEFKKININLAHKYMIKELKKRNIMTKNEFKEMVPIELKFLVYFLNFKEKDYETLNKFLNKSYRG